jgi:hypothetical protein
MGYALLCVCNQIENSERNFSTVCHILSFYYKSFVVSIITTNRYPEDEPKADRIKARWVSMHIYKRKLDT